MRRRSNKVVKWKGASNGGRPCRTRTFRDINSVGWVNEELNLGKLIRVREETNRVVFEFDQKGRFDAWSSLKNTSSGSENKAKLRCGYSYIIRGTMRVSCKSNKKYERGSSSPAMYSILLGKIHVVREEPTSPTRSAQSNENCLKDLKTKIAAGRYFTVRVENLKIISGEIYRYLGCETCSTGIPTPDRNSKFYCSQCLKKSGPKTRRMCTIIRGLKVKDPTDCLENLVIYHHEIEKLLGAQCMEEICSSFTDCKARIEFQNLIGRTIKANIVYQQPTGSKLKRFNWAKLIVKDIEAVIRRPSNQEPIPGPSSSSSVVASSRAEIPEGDESDGDEDDANSFPATSNSFNGDYNEGNVSNVDNNRPCLEVDRTGAYPLIKSSTGFYGLVSIININTDVGQSPRKGSEQDVKVLEEVFPKLGMKIFTGKAILNPNEQMFKQMLKDFKEELITDKYHCFFLVFMGHGSQNSVSLADNKKLNVYNDIMCQFSEDRFGYFNGKPKIFIYESCQDALAGQNFSVSPAAPMTDLLWITPSMPGQKAKRNPTNGCYFIQTLVNCFYKYRSFSLRDIICKMSQMLASGPRQDGGYYVPTEYGRAFRQFYFPGE